MHMEEIYYTKNNPSSELGLTKSSMVINSRKVRISHQRCSVKRCSEKFDKIHRKTPVPESLF